MPSAFFYQDAPEYDFLTFWGSRLDPICLGCSSMECFKVRIIAFHLVSITWCSKQIESWFASALPSRFSSPPLFRVGCNLPHGMQMRNQKSPISLGRSSLECFIKGRIIAFHLVSVTWCFEFSCYWLAILASADTCAACVDANEDSEYIPSSWVALFWNVLKAVSSHLILSQLLGVLNLVSHDLLLACHPS